MIKSENEDLPKLLNFVKKVGLLKFKKGNIISPKIIGTVLYRSQICSNEKFVTTGLIFPRIKLLSFKSISLVHITEFVGMSVRLILYAISKIKRK